MADLAHWLGGVEPRDETQAARDAAQMIAGIPKANRANLTASKQSKLKKFAKEGMEFKFSLLAPLDGTTKPTIDKLKGVYSVTICVEELCGDLQQYGMHNIFLIASDWTHDVNEDKERPAAGAQPIDLFTSHAEFSLDTIKKALTFFQQHRQD